jgi:hypothetical protein
MKRTKKTPAKNTTNRTAKARKSKSETAVKDAAATTATPTTPRAATQPRERDERLPAVGQTITKTWHKKTLSVLCTAEGFEYDGKPYASLSSVAKAASGFPSVNGFLFFGLIGRKPAKAKDAKASAAVDGLDLATPAGQRAALAAAGIAKKGAKGKASKGEKPATGSTTEPR